MKKVFLFAALIGFALGGYAQEKKITIKPYGFIRNYACFDTRESYTSNSEQFYYMPLDREDDINKKDLNENPNMMLLSITTRLGLNITGPEFLGSKTSAKIEADFAGFGTSNTVLRIRQAYAKMAWEKQDLLVGQAWHPMMGDMMPDVFSLETGAPFTPFSRSPQVRYNYINGKYTFTATALYQYQYTSYGPNAEAGANYGKSTGSFDFARNAVVPEMYLQFMYKGDKFQGGVGVDYLTLKPRTFTAELDNNKLVNKRKVDEIIGTASATAFASYKDGNWGIKGRVTYAENASHLSMISGYAITKIDEETGEQEYSPLRSIAAWMDITYKQKLEKGSLTYCLFAGYTKNLGCANEIVDSNIYMRGKKNAGYIWRVAPSILYTHNAMQIGIEYNPTTVNYGTTVDNHYRIDGTHAVTNHRVCAMLKYNF